MNNVIKLFVAFMASMLLAQTAKCATAIYQVNATEGTFLQVPLSREVYTYSRQPNLQDLVVLDANQTPLPYRLVSIAPANESAAEKIISIPLNFFPVSVDATPDTLRKLHRTQIKSQDNDVQVTTSDKVLSNKTPEFYLIDVSQLDNELNSLSIDWVAQANSEYLEVELEASRNLQDWFSLSRGTLVQINQQDQSLKRNHLDAKVAKKEYEFLRLRILRGAENLQITRITGEKKLEAIVEKPAKEIWQLKGSQAKDQTTVYLPNSHSKTYPVAAWEFIRNETTPVDTLGIDFGTTTYGDNAKIFSRKSENQNWQLQTQGIWFNAQVGNQWQKSNPVNIFSNRDKYWRIELNESVKNNFTPGLILGWQPTQLQIIANNKPPYMLVINDNKSTTYNQDQVFKQILSEANPVWIRASLTSLNVQPEAVIDTQTTIDWKQWLFWVALLLAVGVLLVFSLKLLKQLNTNNAG